ncbi:AAA domain-containing protein [Bacillus sp. MUM 13]|uniref:AAA domain-containing protein n=1 Tax=Bacillus sp. MUM 13 TaxID=1678001 RepID=UPI000AAA566B|nr:AAA domain-containing protein [Bacillus sp. MUM 13]
MKNSVGTVHTFQGKEAEIVYLVTGTDEKGDGAANWSCSKPNLINVAVTRAKNEFYVIGDYKRFSKKPYYASIVENIEIKCQSLH